MATWSWAAASRRGSAHAERGERRQDAFRTAAPAGEHGILTVVACDGAGSASHGGEGASLAAWALTEAARNWLSAEARMPEPDTVVGWVQEASLTIAKTAARAGLNQSDFATTVVMALSDGGSTLSAHIGDGAIVGRDCATGAWFAPSWPEHGEYAATTYFLSESEWPRTRIALHDRPIDRLVVMTDGLERLALDFRLLEPHVPFFEAVSRPLAGSAATGLDRSLSLALGRYLDSGKILERTDDDKTLIVAAWA